MKSFPFPAFVIRAPLMNGHTDSTGVIRVDVKSFDQKTGLATVIARNGHIYTERQYPFADLASSPAAAAAKLEKYFQALLTLPPLLRVDGLKASGADLLAGMSAVSKTLPSTQN